MRHWTQVSTASIPGSDETLSLYQDKHDFHIKIAGSQDLMSTRKHGSEDALGNLPCKKLQDTESAKVLIGGLGMGFTLAAVLASVGSCAEVTVAELIPDVVDWNRGPLGEYSGYPLKDTRTRVYIGDVAQVLCNAKGCYDVIALDVDNGPEGFTRSSNHWLYTLEGIQAARDAMTPHGILAYWSAGADKAFHHRLERCRLKVEEVMVYAHGNKGARHTIWLAMPAGS